MAIYPERREINPDPYYNDPNQDNGFQPGQSQIQYAPVSKTPDELYMEAPSGTEGLSKQASQSGNPYMTAAGGLMEYMKAKEQQFRAKQLQEMQLAQNYEKGQQAGLNSLQNAWAKALGR